MSHMTAGQAAGKWWADKLRRPNDVQDNGGRDELNNKIRPTLSSITKTFCADLDEATIQKFQDEIVKIVDDRLGFLEDMQSKFPDGMYGSSIGLVVDYEPQWMLREAYVAAGLDTRKHLLPYKTDMEVSLDRVTVKCGYDAPRVEVWKR